MHHDQRYSSGIHQQSQLKLTLRAVQTQRNAKDYDEGYSSQPSRGRYQE